MNIQVRYFAVLTDEAGCDRESVSTGASTVGALYEELRARHGFRLARASVRAAVDDEFCSWDLALKDGMTVAFVPPVSGG